MSASNNSSQGITEAQGALRGELRLLAENLENQGHTVVEVPHSRPPHIEVSCTEKEVGKVRAFLEETNTNHDYRIISPAETITLRSWPPVGQQAREQHSVFIVPNNGPTYTAEQRNERRSSHL